MPDFPPLPVPDLSVFSHPLAKPYRFVAWDFEVYATDTLCCFFDCTTGERMAVWGCERIGAYLKALLFDDTVVLCGYNSRAYDNVIAAVCMVGHGQRVVKIANDVMMGNLPMHFSKEWGVKKTEFARRGDIAFETPGYFDLYRVSYDAGFDLGTKKIGSDKVPALSLKTWQKLNGIPVHRTPVPFDKPFLTPEDKAAIEHYCHYDVASVVCLMAGKEGSGNLLGRAGLIAEKPEKMRWGMTKPRLSEVYLEADKALCPKKDDPLPNGGVVQIPACIRIEKYTGVSRHFSQPSFALERASYSCRILGQIHNFGIGGLHSDCDKPERFEGDIWDIDAGSLYPSIMIQYGLSPRSVPDADAFTKLRNRRIALKKQKDPMADALKIVLNSTFGATKNEYSALYDPIVGLSVCVIGQLLLVDLLERLEPYVERLIQSNTDGLYLLLKDKAGADAAVAEFERRTGMTMEWKQGDFMYQHNVNNYVFRGKDGNLTLRGGMFRTAHASVSTPAQRVAVQKALKQPVDMSQFSIKDFAVTCTRDKNSRCFRVNGAEVADEYLEVVAVSPFDACDIVTINKDESVRKARLCPDAARPLKDVTMGMIDTDYYLNVAVEESETNTETED